MIVIPALNPALLKTFEADFGTSIAQSLWQRIIDHLNWLNDALPIGCIVYFYQSQTYANGGIITSPNSSWQICDGSVVANSNSVMNGITMPDLRGLFLKGDANQGLTGGSETQNLSHNHGGNTGDRYDGENNTDTAGGSEQGGPSTHHHSIQSDLGTITMLPPFAELQAFMRIA